MPATQAASLNPYLVSTIPERQPSRPITEASKSCDELATGEGVVDSLDSLDSLDNLDNLGVQDEPVIHQHLLAPHLLPQPQSVPDDAFGVREIEVLAERAIGANAVETLLQALAHIADYDEALQATLARVLLHAFLCVFTPVSEEDKIAWEDIAWQVRVVEQEFAATGNQDVCEYQAAEAATGRCAGSSTRGAAVPSGRAQDLRLWVGAQRPLLRP